MVETVCFIGVMASVEFLVILCPYCLSQDFLDWMIKRTDSVWWKEYSKHLSEITRIKYGSDKWGDANANLRL